MHRRLAQPRTADRAQQARQNRTREQGHAVLLQVAKARDVVAIVPGQLLHDALRAVSARPFVRDAVRVVGRRNRMVCGDDGAARRIVDSRKLVVGDETLPVVAGVPPRPRHRAGASCGPVVAVVPPNGNPRGSDETDVPVDVGVRDVLLRRVEVPEVGDEFPPVPRVRQSEPGLQRTVVVPQRRPRERENPCRVVARARLRPGIVQNRAVPGFTHVQHHILVVPNPNSFASNLELAPAVRGEVAPMDSTGRPFR